MAAALCECVSELGSLRRVSRSRSVPSGASSERHVCRSWACARHHTMPRKTCSVFGCVSTSRTTPYMTYFRLPKEDDRLDTFYFYSKRSCDVCFDERHFYCKGTAIPQYRHNISDSSVTKGGGRIVSRTSRMYFLIWPDTQLKSLTVASFIRTLGNPRRGTSLRAWVWPALQWTNQS